MSPRAVAILQATAVVAAGSLAGVLAKRSLGAVHPFTFAWLQVAIGGVLLTAYTFGRRRERIPGGLGRKVWIYIALLGLLNFALVRVMFLLALDRLPATTNAYLVNYVGIATMLLSIVMLGERPNGRQWIGAIVALIGIRVFFDEIPAADEMTGVLYLGIGVLGLATTNNIARKLVVATEGQLSTNVISTVAIWIGGTPLVMWGAAFDRPLEVPDLESWGTIALNGLVSIAIGMTVWNHILRTLRSYEASLLGALAVVFTALFAIPILGERLALHQVGGIAILLAGLALVQARRDRSR